MDDTRLLELAGLAAGEQYGPERNPLDRDDLALRLAVKLGIHLQFAMGFAAAYAGSVHAKQFTELCGDDENAATRRAIVRAAASIGQEGRNG